MHICICICICLCAELCLFAGTALYHAVSGGMASATGRGGGEAQGAGKCQMRLWGVWPFLSFGGSRFEEEFMNLGEGFALGLRRARTGAGSDNIVHCCFFATVSSRGRS